jgi:hypothetical protein
MQPELAFDGWIAASEWAPARLMRSVRRQRHVRNRGGIRSFMLDYLVRVRGDHGERQHIDRAKADLFVLRPQMSLGKPSIPRPSQPERVDTLRNRAFDSSPFAIKLLPIRGALFYSRGS